MATMISSAQGTLALLDEPEPELQVRAPLPAAPLPPKWHTREDGHTRPQRTHGHGAIRHAFSMGAEGIVIRGGAEIAFGEEEGGGRCKVEEVEVAPTQRGNAALCGIRRCECMCVRALNNCSLVYPGPGSWVAP